VEKPELVARARELGIGNVTFQGSVSRAAVPLILAAADAGLVMLRRGPLYEDSLPTKLLETMAASRPVIVSADGLSARIVESSGAGYVAAAEDSVGLGHAIDASRQDPDRAQRGAAGRARVARDYERGAILDRLAEILRKAARTA
jgi:glycosyltransferase involved in cell wall biosynthesis